MGFFGKVFQIAKTVATKSIPIVKKTAAITQMALPKVGDMLGQAKDLIGNNIKDESVKSKILPFLDLAQKGIGPATQLAQTIAGNSDAGGGGGEQQAQAEEGAPDAA